MDEKEKLTHALTGQAVDGDTAASELEADREERDRRAQNLRMKLRRLPTAAIRMIADYRKNAKRHALEGVAGLSLGLCAYLLGSSRLLFGQSPLGLALLCASPKKILWIFAGLAVSAFTLPDNVFIYIFAYATAVTVRILARLLVDAPAESAESLRDGGISEIKRRGGAIFTESIYLRMATGAVAAFIVGIFYMIASDFEYYSLFGAIFSMLCVPAAVFVYAGAFEENECDARFRKVAIGALLVSVTFALRELYLVGISAGAFFAFFITLCVCKQSGIWQGALLGLLAGLAYSPVYAPMFALSGITVGVLWNISAFGSLVAGGTAAMLWGFYIEGASAMSRLLPAVMLSFVCYMGVQRLSVFPAAKELIFSGRYCRQMNDAAIAVERVEASNDRITRLSDTFASLSEVFCNLSDRLSRPPVPELRRMCDRVYDKYCPMCPSREICWEIEYSSSKEMLSELGKKLGERGLADPEDLPEYMKARCVALPGIIGEINRECAELYKSFRLADKTGALAMEYGSVSVLLSGLCEENKKDHEPDRELSTRLADALAEFGFGEGGVSVYGERRKKIVARGFDISKGCIGNTELKKVVEKACGFPVSEPVIELSENLMTLRMTSARRFSAGSVIRTKGAEEDICGDSVASFESCDDRYFALISDGMGTGEEASVTSSICSIFLQKMIAAGNSEFASVKMLNSFIRSKTGECSSTVDLMDVDLLTGRVSFTKCGAALSLVKRGDKIFKLSAATMPLGILDRIDAGRLSFDCEDGDVVIMVSDGVLASDEEEEWLVGLLTSEWDEDLDRMAKRIISRTLDLGHRDDISVILTRIKDE